ncbi:hypothetical protein OOJ91_13900 [Micromonospora lupini]|uniref:hypothetical protein n=1 Tax=Micromonospora lupini TaxID=285679 RepID=UPI002259CFB6|nr:hypothetical protein [Micromonospora lupini]MCX5066941.1 hypothetical protein [Micromonospora lupini]
MAPVTDQAAVVDAGPCRGCGCEQWNHRMGRKGCKDAVCGCGKYEPPKAAPADPLKAAYEQTVEELGRGFDVESGLAAVLAEPEPVDEPEPEPVPVVADPVAQADSVEQVAAIDAQLAEPDRAEPPTVADRPMPPKDFLAAHTHVSDRAAAGYGWQQGYLAAQAATAAELTAARHEAAEALNRAGHLRAKRDEERRQADRLDGELRNAVAELEQVRAEKTRLAGQLAPRLADLDQALGELAKLRNVNVELGRAHAEIDRLSRERDDARKALKNTADAYVQTSIAAATNVLYRYDANQCTTEGCGSRYTVPVDHPHRLTPVTVLVVRREVAS